MNLLLMKNNKIYNKCIMGLFKKIYHSVVHIGKKAGSGISHAFKKSGRGIVKGVSSLAGGALGAEIGGGLALALAPEFALPAMAIGGLAGRELGKEGGGIAYSSLEKKRPQGKPAVHSVGVFQGTGGKTGMRPSNPSKVTIPDGRFFRQPPRLGMDGAGQRQTNPIEKARPPEKKMDMFM
jgi:hypothetical protein